MKTFSNLFRRDLFAQGCPWRTQWKIELSAFWSHLCFVGSGAAVVLSRNLGSQTSPLIKCSQVKERVCFSKTLKQHALSLNTEDTDFNHD